MHEPTMRHLVFASALLAFASPSKAADSIFSKLVAATANSDQRELARLLSAEKLSASDGTVGLDNRRSGGTMRHGVSVAEVAAKLKGCTVKQWRDVGRKDGSAYILWACPTKRVPQNDCYFYSYRAEMLDPRYHPANLLVLGTPTRDYDRCGSFIVPPPQP